MLKTAKRLGLPPQVSHVQTSKKSLGDVFMENKRISSIEYELFCKHLFKRLNCFIFKVMIKFFLG